jgi:hypothetical protein
MKNRPSKNSFQLENNDLNDFYLLVLNCRRNRKEENQNRPPI